MNSEKIPGMACVALSDLGIVYADGLGRTSIEQRGAPVTPETIFRIGSITKALTGTATLRLADAGRLDLEAPVREYLPWFTLGEHVASESITPRMLLTHTSGLPTGMDDLRAPGVAGLAGSIRAELQKCALLARPGAAFSYSNLGFALLGCVTEATTGQAYPDLMADLVFEPLQMSKTALDATLIMGGQLSQSHKVAPDGSLRVVPPSPNNAAHAPAGSALSTALDLANFARMLLGRGRFGSGQFLSPKTVSAMSTIQVATYTPGAGGRGLAMFVDPHPRCGLPRTGHMGGINGYRALLEVYPTLSAAVVVLMNRAGDYGAVRDILLEECFGVATTGWHPLVTEPCRSAWPDYLGAYISDEAGLAEITVQGDLLCLEWNGDCCRLDRLGVDHYVSEEKGRGIWLGVGFIRGSDGLVGHLMLSEMLFRRVQPVSVRPHPATWNRYEGAYALRQPPMRIRVDGASLLLHSDYYGREVRCVPLSDTEFACQWGRFSFQANEGGRVEGIMWAGKRFIPRLSE